MRVPRVQTPGVSGGTQVLNDQACKGVVLHFKSPESKLLASLVHHRHLTAKDHRYRGGRWFYGIVSHRQLSQHVSR